MQKNKKATIIIILAMLAYGLFAEFYLSIKINKIYLYIINPIVWIGIAIFLKTMLGKSYEVKKLKKDITNFLNLYTQSAEPSALSHMYLIL